MTQEEKVRVWNEARDHTQRMIANEMFQHYNNDKFEFLRVLMSKAFDLSRDTTLSEEQRQKWAAYGEGIRHALNLVKNLGSAQECYDNMLNKTMTINFTKEEFLRYSYKGH
jgi:hypothetical protein